jgi:hypothetical protein
MVKITVSADCGNSPRKVFLKDLNIAFAKGEPALIRDNVADDISWQLVGDQDIRGKDAFVDAVMRMRGDNLKALTVATIITHGKEAAVNGEWLLENGNTYSFCDLYTFQGAKGNTIKSIASYMIEVK